MRALTPTSSNCEVAASPVVSPASPRITTPTSSRLVVDTPPTVCQTPVQNSMTIVEENEALKKELEKVREELRVILDHSIQSDQRLLQYTEDIFLPPPGTPSTPVDHLANIRQTPTLISKATQTEEGVAITIPSTNDCGVQCLLVPESDSFDDSDTDVPQLTSCCSSVNIASNDSVLLKHNANVINKDKYSDNWLSDDNINCYFNEMSKCVNGNEILFLGPALTQCIKMGSVETVGDNLSSTSFYTNKFSFLCINNNIDAGTCDTGTHWSLLFLDNRKSEGFHFDSSTGMNKAAACKVASNLNVPLKNLFEMTCFQQKNGFECGLNVIVNAKFILHYYCMRMVDMSFKDWHESFSTGVQIQGESTGCPIDTYHPDVVSKPNINCTAQLQLDGRRGTSARWKVVPVRNKAKANRSRNVPKDMYIPVNSNKFEMLSNNCSDVHDKQSSPVSWVTKPVAINNNCYRKINPKLGKLNKPWMSCEARAPVAGPAVLGMAQRRPGEASPVPMLSLFGDSHGRHLSSLLLSRLAPKHNVSGHVIPGGRLCHVLGAAGPVLERASQGDHVVIMAGTNDFNDTVNKCNSSKLVKQIEQIITKPTKAHLLILGIPLRYDTTQYNNVIMAVNSQLEKLCKTCKNASFVPLSRLRRRHHTVHGLHLNNIGKRVIANVIGVTVCRYDFVSNFGEEAHSRQPGEVCVAPVGRGGRGEAGTSSGVTSTVSRVISSSQNQSKHSKNKLRPTKQNANKTSGSYFQNSDMVTDKQLVRPIPGSIEPSSGLRSRVWYNSGFPLREKLISYPKHFLEWGGSRPMMD